MVSPPHSHPTGFPGTLECSASIRKPGSEASVLCKAPLATTHQKTRGLEKHIISIQDFAVSCYPERQDDCNRLSPVVTTPQPGSRAGMCSAAKSFLTALLRGAAHPPEPFSGAAPAPALLPERCRAQTASLTKTPHGFLLIPEPGNGKSIICFYRGAPLPTNKRRAVGSLPARFS